MFLLYRSPAEFSSSDELIKHWFRSLGTIVRKSVHEVISYRKSVIDANGNTLTDSSGKSYTWDFENRLMQAVVPGTNGGTTTFKYDPFGRRIYKQSPSFTSIFVYDGPNLIQTMNGSGSEVASYAQGRYIDEVLGENRSGESSYYEQDGVNSVTSLTTSAGAAANTYTYDSFGNLTNSAGTLGNPFRYTGREFDPETGLYFYRSRYYDAVAGRRVAQALNG